MNDRPQEPGSVQFGQLNDLLNKSHIIPTISAEQLKRAPAEAEHDYAVHARTHIPLGDTSKYIETAFRWVGGDNRGAFIGGVTGAYGEGKTSFLVHMWDRLSERGVVVTPPFSWRSISDVIDTVRTWAHHKLHKTHPDHSHQADLLWEKYREKSLEETAKRTAEQTGESVDVVLKILRASPAPLEASADQLLDYCDELSAVLIAAGYKGLLVLLDEPEVVAKGGDLSNDQVAQILFDLANGLLSREGSYGVFISAPENFMAHASAAFTSLVARLQGRKCFVTLATLYNDDFADALWAKYGKTLGFEDQRHEIIDPATLQGLGQLSSSARRDLAFGPRTVITAFRRAVELFIKTGATYTPCQLIVDAMDQEVAVQEEYVTRIAQALTNQEASRIGADAVRTLAAFPGGVQLSQLRHLGVNLDHVEQLAKPGHPHLYKKGGYVGLKVLLKSDTQGDADFVQDAVVELANHYAPQPAVFEKALDAFQRDIFPTIFPRKQANQFGGWKHEVSRRLAPGVRLASLMGFVDQTRLYPMRKVDVLMSGPGLSSKHVIAKYPHGAEPEVLLHLRFRLQAESRLPEPSVYIDPGDPAEGVPALIELAIDLCEPPVGNAQLASYTGDPDLLTPLFCLFVLDGMNGLALPIEDGAVWNATRSALIPDLLAATIGDPRINTEAARAVGSQIPGNVFDLVPSLLAAVLKLRLPNYTTLIRSTAWTSKIQGYINVLKNATIPLSARRGHETWKASKDEVSKAFNASKMTLESWAVGLEPLLQMTEAGGQVTVRFLQHPMESLIQSMIMEESNDGRVKIDGRDCWWVDLSEIGRLLLTSGYGEDELQAIVDVGRARGTFDVDKHSGRPILYVRPFDPEQLRAKLTDKANSLRAHVSVFERIHNYHLPELLQQVDGLIDSVNDDVSYEAIENRINRAFEADHERLKYFRQNLEEQAVKLVGTADAFLRDVIDPRGHELVNAPSFRSSWGSDLVSYVLSNLQEEGKKLHFDVRALREEARTISEKAKDVSGTPLQQAERIVEGWDDSSGIQSSLESAKARVHVFSGMVSDYASWRNLLLNRSDVLYASLLSDKKDPTNGEETKRFLRDLESLWSEVSEHLRLRGVTGLGSHKQFESKFEVIENARQGLLRDQKNRFESKKQTVNEMLTTLSLPVRVAETFNPADVEGCFGRLHGEASAEILKALGRELGTLRGLERELAYASDVLRRLTPEATNSVVAELARAEQALEELGNTITAVWVAEVSGQQEHSEVEALRVALVDCSKVSQAARTVLRESLPKQPTLSPQAESVLALVEEGRDLKAVVLALIAHGHQSNIVLDEALAGLVELFRAGRVDITVGAPKR